MIGIVFPGQGSQRVGMAKDFCEEHSPARAVFEEATDTLQMDMAALCFSENEKLLLTEYTQPAILTAEIAMYRTLCQVYGLEADYFGGHSLGEYTALTASGALSLGDALRIVRKRGALMQTACPPGQGSMAAVLSDNIEETKYKKHLNSSGAELANRNSSSQIVISGYTDAVDKTIAALEKDVPKIRCIKLDVSAPFHSSIMRPAEAAFASFLENFDYTFDEARCSRVLSNYTGSFHKAETLQKNLIKQISGSVLWVENMKQMTAAVEKIYEIGPNKPLTGFFASLDVSISPIISLRSARRIFEKT